MIFGPPARNLRAELLDIDEAPFEEVKQSLQDVRKVNRYLSGYRVLTDHVKPFLENHKESRPFTILDLATGSGDQPMALVKLARKMQIPVRVTGIDINPKMLAYAREANARFPEIRFVQCDIHCLPFKENGFDLVVNSLSLHHFSESDVVQILKAMNFSGRLGFIVNDLHRSRIAHAVIWVLTRLLTKNRLTRYDAPVSVMNAFTPKEFKGLAEQAGIQQFEIIRHFPYRIAILSHKPSPA